MDRVHFNGTTMLPVLGTPNWLRAAVAYLDPYTAPVPAFTMGQGSSNVRTAPSMDVGGAVLGDEAKPLCITDLADGSWTLTRQVDFGQC